MTLKQWFDRNYLRPLKLVSVFLFIIWMIFFVRSYLIVDAKQDSYVKQTADLLSLAISQRNRVFAESLLETLLSQGGASFAEICDLDRQQIGLNTSTNGCYETSSISDKVVEELIPGSAKLKLRAKFNRLGSFTTALAILWIAFLFAVSGLYLIRVSQKRVKSDLFDPILSKLLGEDDLKISELTELRQTIQTAKELESQRAVTLAIQENNQQVAHDIRGPVQAINALFKMTKIEDANLKVAIEKSLSRANAVANELLKTQIATELQIAAVPFDLGLIIRDLVTEKQVLFSFDQIAVEASRHLFLEGSISREAVSRVISNLLDNAILACERGGSVSIYVTCCNRIVEVSVRDTGCGIPDHILSRVGEKGFTQRELGSGRGVYSARKVLESMGGTLALASRAGEGTTVTIRIPVHSVEGMSRVDFVLIDDEEIHRLTWQIWAKKRGYELKAFKSVEEFLMLADSIPRSATVFLDFHLDNAITANNYLSGLFGLGFLKIILVTGSQDLLAASFIGVSAIIGKDPNEAQHFI
ncbi:MAG: sensor histidine kinase [Bdellovibrionales bacterium]